MSPKFTSNRNTKNTVLAMIVVFSLSSFTFMLFHLCLRFSVSFLSFLIIRLSFFFFFKFVVLRWGNFRLPNCHYSFLSMLFSLMIISFSSPPCSVVFSVLLFKIIVVCGGIVVFPSSNFILRRSPLGGYPTLSTFLCVIFVGISHFLYFFHFRVDPLAIHLSFLICLRFSFLLSFLFCCRILMLLLFSIAVVS